ncbi:MAG: SMC family ATPase [Cyanobacteria bacterium J06632_22]
MTPKRLSLKHFLSYCEAQIDFSGLHVACICGPNGAGKSSLLEAMAWAIWGQGRSSCEDDMIHLGAQEARVDFIFEHRQSTYRVIRSRRRRQHSGLEFQIDTGDGFRSLTQRGIRATQRLILQHLQVDYETFVHSAYLRQGQADEFMRKRPTERKQILADLLKLSHYDTLATRAKDQSREYKALAFATEQAQSRLANQLAQQGPVQIQYRQVDAQFQQLQAQQQDDQVKRDRLQQQQQQRQQCQVQQHSLQQQLSWLQTQRTQLQVTQQRLQQRQARIKRLLADRPTILTQCEAYQQQRQQADQMAQQAQSYQRLQLQIADQTQARAQALAPLLDQQRQQQLQLNALTEQQQDLLHTLEAKGEIDAALAKLAAAKARLSELDRCQLARAPLLQQQLQLRLQQQQSTAQITARLDSITHTQQQLVEQQQQQPSLQQAVAHLSRQITYLEQRRAYQEQVRLKGQERRSFMEKLQAEQRILEAELGHLDQKLRLFKDPEAPCPVCDRPLQDHSAELAQTYQQDYDDTQKRIWVIREQLAVSEREIQVLRQEYRDLEAELHPYAATLEQRGQLQAQLQAQAATTRQLTDLTAEQQQLERCLQGDSQYAVGQDLYEKLQALNQELAQLNYDERDHALVRNQIEKLRWVEVRKAELIRAERRLRHVEQRIPQQHALLARTTGQLHALDSGFEQTIADLSQSLAALDYCPQAHESLRQQLQQNEPIWVQYQALQQAEQQQAELNQQLMGNTAALATNQAACQQIKTALAPLEKQLTALPDPAVAIATLDDQIQVRQTQREALMAHLGQLKQQLSEFEARQAQFEQLQRQLQQQHHQQRVYQSLAQAFGKNGLQAMVIENLLPQLEAETNHLLSRLSNHQLHVQFITQRASRSRDKLIDTLDILVADTQGTRPYETYSGGEAFRVNFALRLALARVLAQRSGMALQMLVVDEGFGSQDQAGCDRLVAAINAIAPDFSCILTVTHRSHFREAFQTRIDICKTDQGSQLRVSA